MAIDSRKPKRSATEMARWLEKYPEVAAGVEQCMEAIENADGDLAKADEAEQRFVEVMRQMGQRGLQAWADRKNEKVIRESDQRGDLRRREKRGSIGTPDSGESK